MGPGNEPLGVYWEMSMQGNTCVRLSPSPWGKGGRGVLKMILVILCAASYAAVGVVFEERDTCGLCSRC